MTAGRPSIAELQRIEREDLVPAPWEALDWWSPSDRGKVALRNAAPVVLAITAAALALLEAGMCDHAHCEEGCPSGDAWNALAAAAGKVRR